MSDSTKYFVIYCEYDDQYRKEFDTEEEMNKWFDGIEGVTYFTETFQLIGVFKGVELKLEPTKIKTTLRVVK